MMFTKHALLAVLSLWACDAFTAIPRYSMGARSVESAQFPATPAQPTRLYAEHEETSAEEATAEAEGAEQEAEPEEAVEEEEPEPEDPEVTALKQEIADLESAFKAKQNQLETARDQAELYSKGGYARKVAEMENMRRLRSSLNSSSKEAAMASVVANFLPMLDELRALKEKYKDDEFGSGYNALAGDMNGALRGLGVEEYTAPVGEMVDVNRHQVVKEEYSEKFSKGTIMQPLTMGLELQGNVMRMAECVVSLGREADEVPAEEEEEEENQNTSDQSDEADAES